MGKDQHIATWAFMIVTALCRHLDLPRSAFVPLAQKYNVIGFLFDQYELLHYYDNSYVVDDVMRYIEEQGGNSHELSRSA